MIRVEGLYKSYISDGRQEVAVRGISFQHEEGEFLTLLGPSGCGKTTTLRCIAGLETPEEGEIYIGDHLVFSSDRGVNLSPARRHLGMVFQSYAIWPHMTVFDNVAYPLRFERVSKKDKRTRVEQILESVGMTALAQRPAPALSGGQQQRVALARALVAEPEVLLLDEPLSNLDASLRRDLGNHIRDLQRRLGLTVIYVTHDQTEAMSMSDRIALMDSGKILERGAPVDIYQSPQTEFGARFVGEANLFAAESVTSTDTGWTAKTDLGRLSVSASPPDTGPEERYSVLIRPESLTINQSPAPEKDWNVFDGVIEASRYFGFYWELEVRLPDSGPLLKVKSLAKKGYDPGTSVRVAAHREACVLVRRISPTGPQPDPEDEKPQEAPDMADLNGP